MFGGLTLILILILQTEDESVQQYRGAFFKTSNSSSVGKGRPKTSFGLGFFFSLVGIDSRDLQGKENSHPVTFKMK